MIELKRGDKVIILSSLPEVMRRAGYKDHVINECQRMVGEETTVQWYYNEDGGEPVVEISGGLTIPRECVREVRGFIEERVIDRIRLRRLHGLRKYGVGMEREDLTHKDWLLHALEESMDHCIYLEKQLFEVEEMEQAIGKPCQTLTQLLLSFRHEQPQRPETPATGSGDSGRLFASEVLLPPAQPESPVADA